jgi:hypothetical protein
MPYASIFVKILDFRMKIRKKLASIIIAFMLGKTMN